MPTDRCLERSLTTSCDMLPSVKGGASAPASTRRFAAFRSMPTAVSRELGAMADPLLHRLPLADPSSDSLGRLNGQYPALTDVDCADDVGVPLVAAHLTAEPIPGGTVVCMCVAASGGWTAQRSVWRRGEFNPAAAFPVPCRRGTWRTYPIPGRECCG